MSRQHPSVNDLPTETLTLIFKSLFVQSRPQGSSVDFAVEQDSTKWPWDDGAPHPAMFPYAPASVCARWRDILLQFSEFWTRIVVIVGYNPSWLSDFRSQLELAVSQDAHLEVFVMKDRSRTAEDPLEEEHVSAVVNMLSPHVQRCSQLSFDLHRTSSLPSVWDELDHSPHLISLKLNGNVHHERTIGSPIISDPVAGGDFIFPKLRYLAIDGRNFIDACKRFPSWIEELCARDSGFVLSIAHLSRSEGEDAHFSLYDALGFMTNLRYLELKNTEFTIEPGSEDFQPINLDLIALTFEDLSEEFICEFLFVTSFNDEFGIPPMTFTRCPLAAIEMSSEISDEITLRQYTDSDELLRFFQSQICSAVAVEDCSGFDDHFLGQISADDNISSSGAVGLAAWRTLMIVGCNNFSMQALKQMVSAHRRGMEPELDLMVYGIPLPSKDDEAWFRDNLAVFSWRSDLEWWMGMGQ